MMQIADLPLWMRAAIKIYPWRRIDPVPCATLAKPVRECTVALVSSAGLVTKDQTPFDESIKGGDFSYRVIDADTEVQSLIETHRSEAFDHSGIARDKNVGFPLERLREMAADSEIGAVAPRHLSFMGSITAPGRLIKQTAPAAAALLVEDGVDLALLFPA